MTYVHKAKIRGDRQNDKQELWSELRCLRQLPLAPSGKHYFGRTNRLSKSALSLRVYSEWGSAISKPIQFYELNILQHLNTANKMQIYSQFPPPTIPTFKKPERLIF